MKFVSSLVDLTDTDVAIAGGKAASLSMLLRNNNPVPNGFVILTNAFDEFINANNLNSEIEVILANVDINNPKKVSTASKKIKKIILNKRIPKGIVEEIESTFHNLNSEKVAVRSSATDEDSISSSWAGCFESYLNVDKSNLIESIQMIWASLYNPRCLTYKFNNDIKKDISVGVVVQEMIQSEVSGICFTAHPVTGDKNTVIIEAGFGIGEAIVGGKITPDMYLVHKQKKQITYKQISEQRIKYSQGKKNNSVYKVDKEKQSIQKLSDDQIITLFEKCIYIEEIFGSFQDIEWAFVDNSFYITQSRAITTI